MKMKQENTKLFFKISSLCIAMSMASYCYAQDSIISDVSSTHQWQTEDLVFQTSETLKSPFDINFVAHFNNSKTGEKFNVPGFYDGDNKYVVRVSFPNKGEWSYNLETDIKGLNGKSGEITVKTPKSKGKVQINPKTKTTFIYENGEKHNPNAYELDWLFHLDQKNDDLKETKSIINYIKTGGFNQVIMNVYAWGTKKNGGWGTDVVDPRYNFDHVSEFPFLGSNQKPDYSSLNIDFFKKLDKKIAYLNEQGVQAHLMIYVWNKGVNWAPLGGKEDQRYFDYVVKRYSGYNNIIWDVSKEAMDYGHANAQFLNDKIDRIRQLDYRQHLVTLHDYTYAESPSLAANIDFISIQEWAPNVADKTKELVKLHPSKPIHNIENGCYETTNHRIFNGGYNTAEACLDRNYQIYFNGAYTAHYWQNTSWFELNYEPQKLDKKDQPKMEYQKIFKDFIDSYSLDEYKPHQFHFATWSLVNDKKDMVFYLQANADGVKGHLVPEYKNMKYHAKWISTETGETIKVQDKDMMGYIWLDMPKPKEFTGKPAVLIMEHI